MKELLFIKNAVQEETQIRLSAKIRNREYVNARLIYYAIAKKCTSHSFDRIGSVVSVNHATVMHNLENLERDILKDKRLNQQYRKVLHICQKVLDKNAQATSSLDGLETLAQENLNLLHNVERLKKQLVDAKTLENPQENQLMNIFRKMSFADKKDLLFKAGTILKVREKLSA